MRLWCRSACADRIAEAPNARVHKSGRTRLASPHPTHTGRNRQKQSNEAKSRGEGNRQKLPNETKGRETQPPVQFLAVTTKKPRPSMRRRSLVHPPGLLSAVSRSSLARAASRRFRAGNAAWMSPVCVSTKARTFECCDVLGCGGFATGNVDAAGNRKDARNKAQCVLLRRCAV